MKGHSNLTTKDSLFINLKSFYESQRQSIYEYVPLTIVLDYLKDDIGDRVEQFSQILKIIDKDGKQGFSSVIALKNNKQNFSSISVYPNPIVGNQLSLMLQNIHSGNYDLYLLDMTSRKIPLQNITHSGNDGVIQIKFGNNISKGIYRLVMIGENETLNTPVIIQ